MTLMEKLQQDLEQVAGFKPVLELAPENLGGKIAFSLFGVAQGQNPAKLAEEVTAKLNAEPILYVEAVQAAGPYVNLTPSDKFYNELIKEISDAGVRYGQTNINEGKHAWIEYSSPNIAKPLSVGHLPTTIIGESLARIYEKTGFKVTRHNYVGDWGTQFGKLIYAFQNWGSPENISVEELKNLYIRFHEEAEKDPALEEAARALSKKLEDGDPELLALWQKFRDISIEGFKKTYHRLGVTFDVWLGEYFFTGKMDEVVELCAKQDFCKKDPETGALVIDLGEDIPTFLIRRADGGSLYITRDLASLKYRIETAHPDTLLYVVDSRQELNFKQLFALGGRLGFIKPGQAKHIGFGLISFNGEAMSTRKGTVVELEDLIEQSIKRSQEIIKEKNPALTAEEVEEISEKIGIGAVMYNQLRQSRTKNVSFEWKRMLDFESGSAAYLQYTSVRIKSILEKIGRPASGDYVYELPVEKLLARKLAFYPAAILKAQDLDSPHVIANYLEELAQLFNSFYGSVSIMNTENPELKNSRLALIAAVAEIIESGLNLLIVKVPAKM